MKAVRENFLCSMIVTTLQCGKENNPKKHADKSMALLLAFESAIRQDQKEKCAAAIQDDIGENLFLIQKVMEAD